MNQSFAPLPEFDRPPVTEVVLAVDFAPLINWQITHAGLYWGQINSEYPDTQVHPYMPSGIENFDEALPFGPQIQFNMQPGDSRSWFLSNPSNFIIQVQRDKFTVNWRKVTGDERYPRYDAEIRRRFEKEWIGFKKFVNDKQLGSLTVRQCEIAYINDLVKGRDWDTFPESLGLFAQWLGKGSSGFLPAPESLNITGSFLMSNGASRLHFRTQHSLRSIDQKEVVQLALAARGKPTSSSDADILSWMDLGREWIVRGFTDLTSVKAHTIWGRTR